MLLPAQFWVPHGSPAWRGGVERAFMSTTADKGVALFYANGKGTVVEISVGRIQIGGDVTFLSMVTLPPTSLPRPVPSAPDDTLPSFTCGRGKDIHGGRPPLRGVPHPLPADC